ncbi:CAAX amino terminal protease self- immunity [Candidatus Izimaplasma bacterium HR1]|jgi:membrane protease YdiL (CAAX protease family)|uniref:type II CAAX endopeptidase family protein n=1 Tax=Candidatus Izimoplasma sp. HR1 TaxID=1541959 RepID=UPI0004F79559|nr:CAAX amino terminal protease self- immunity [Candidatus Izimaplasma bacterium HR1]
MSNKKIVLFFAITFGWAWLFWLPYTLPTFGVENLPEWLTTFKMPIQVLGASAPLASALILIGSAEGWQGIKKFFKKVLDFRIKPIYIVIALLLSSVSNIIAHYYPNIMGLEELPNSYFPFEAGLPIFLTVFIYIFVMFLIGGGQEEFGWRGYILEPLQEKLGVIKASLLIGIIWGLWHYPLWLMPGESHIYYSFISFVIFATTFSLIIGIMYNVSGKKFVIAWIMHAASNFFLSLFPVFFTKDVAQPSYMVWIAINIVTAIGLTIWYQTRKNKQVMQTQ